MTTREEEMQMLRARYAQHRGKEIPNQPKTTALTTGKEKENIEKEKNKSILEPYLFLIRNDIRRLFRMKPIEVKRKEKPIDLTWLEKKGGRFW